MKKYMLFDSTGRAYFFSDKEKYLRARNNLRKIAREYEPIERMNEELLAEMGTGPNAWRLPEPFNRACSEDGFYATAKHLSDHG